jgi:hypothetical protein
MFVIDNSEVFNQIHRFIKQILATGMIPMDQLLIRPRCRGKAVPVLHEVLDHEDVWGSGSVDPPIYLSTRWTRVASFMPWLLYS